MPAMTHERILFSMCTWRKKMPSSTSKTRSSEALISMICQKRRKRSNIAKTNSLFSYNSSISYSWSVIVIQRKIMKAGTLPRMFGNASRFRYLQQRIPKSRCSVGSSMPFVVPDVYTLSWSAVPRLLFFNLLLAILIFFSFNFLIYSSASSSELESSSSY